MLKRLELKGGKGLVNRRMVFTFHAPTTMRKTPEADQIAHRHTRAELRVLPQDCKLACQLLAARLGYIQPVKADATALQGLQARHQRQ